MKIFSLSVHFCVLIFSRQTGLLSAVRVGQWIDWKAYDLKNSKCHKSGVHVIKHELQCHVMVHVLHVKKHKTRDLFKIMKCQIWYENTFVKRTFFIIFTFPKQTGL